MSRLILKVAIDAPLRHLFDYLPRFNQPPPAPGCRVRVPFGRRGQVGLVVAHADHADVPDAQLRHIHEAIDDEPLFGAPLLEPTTTMRRPAKCWSVPCRVFCGPVGRPANRSTGNGG
jgi:primosomal protein N' (replication factor Y)